MNAVLDRIACGEHQYHRRRMAFAQTAQDLESVDVGKADVEHHEVERLFDQQSIGVLAGCRVVDRVTCASQEFDQTLREESVIFNDEYAHDRLSEDIGHARRDYSDGPRPMDGMLRP